MALKNKPKCEKKEYQNCFANNNGRCLCLSDNNFRGGGGDARSTKNKLMILICQSLAKSADYMRRDTAVNNKERREQYAKVI